MLLPTLDTARMMRSHASSRPGFDGPPDHDRVRLQARDSVGLHDPDHPALEVGHHVDLAERRESLLLEGPVHLFPLALDVHRLGLEVGLDQAGTRSPARGPG